MDLSVFWTVNIVLVFILSLVCGQIVIPQILLISLRRRLFDLPDDRKIHHDAVSRLGGITFGPVICFSMALVLGIALALGYRAVLIEFSGAFQPLAFGFCAVMVVYLIGVVDDFVGLRYRAKFVMQIIGGLILVSGGIWINDLHGLLGLHAIPEWLGYPLTILAVVFIMNAINLIDGIDGLASSLSGVAAAVYGMMFFVQQKYLYAMLAFALLGVLIAFFYYNVFGDVKRYRKIFMGDTGSLTIGMLLCFLGIGLGVDIPESEGYVPNPMVLLCAPLLVPCLDVFRVYLHRVRNGNNPFLPDKNHIHHKLLALGLKPHGALAVLTFVSVFLTVSNLLLAEYVDINVLAVGDIAVWTAGNILLSAKIRQKKAARDSDACEKDRSAGQNQNIRIDSEK